MFVFYRYTFLVLVFLTVCGANLSSQEVREYYTQKYLEKKQPIDSIAGANLGTIESTIGYTFEEPYYGIFPEDDTLIELTRHIRERTFSKGDTFSVKNLSYPRFNYGIYVSDTTISYYASDFNPEDHLFDKEAFLSQLKHIKTLDIGYIVPLWGLIYCNEIDDYGVNEKIEKWWITTKDHDVYVKVSRDNKEYYLSIAMDLSHDTHGNDMTHLGCAIPESSYIQLNFKDGTSLKKYHMGKEENCFAITVDISNEFELLQNKLESIELSLSKEVKVFPIPSKVQADVLSLKCDCVR